MNNNKLYRLMMILVAAMLFTNVNGQVTIGKEAQPTNGAVLDLSQVDAKNLGLLLPKVPLTSLTAWSPVIGSPVDGMFIYNTTTIIANNLIPGTYYWKNNKWNLLTTLSDAWLVGGNTNGSIQNIGTKENYSLPFITNNTEKMRLTTDGKFGIGTTTPATKLEINNGNTAGAIKIVDGTQGLDKVLTSDANGIGTWQTPVGSVVNGVVPSTITTFNPTVYSPFQSFYTGCYITIPAGKWRVDMMAWIEMSGTSLKAPANSSNIFASLLLSTNSATITPPTFAAANIRSIIIPDLYTRMESMYAKYGGGAIFVDLSTTTTLYLWSLTQTYFENTSVALPNANAFKIISRNGDTGTYGPYVYLVATKI